MQARAEYGTLDASAEARPVAQRLVAFLAEVDAAQETLATDRTSVRDLAIGAAREEVEIAVAELAHQDYRQRGRVTVRELSVFAAKAPVKRLVVVCVDDSRVEIVAGNGFVVRPAAKAPRAALHRYTMQKVARDWKVLAHDMPADTTCGPA